MWIYTIRDTRGFHRWLVALVSGLFLVTDWHIAPPIVMIATDCRHAQRERMKKSCRYSIYEVKTYFTHTDTVLGVSAIGVINLYPCHSVGWPVHCIVISHTARCTRMHCASIVGEDLRLLSLFGKCATCWALPSKLDSTAKRMISACFHAVAHFDGNFFYCLFAIRCP